jgi:hypothetical protein
MFAVDLEHDPAPARQEKQEVHPLAGKRGNAITLPGGLWVIVQPHLGHERRLVESEGAIPLGVDKEQVTFGLAGQAFPETGMQPRARRNQVGVGFGGQHEGDEGPAS